MQKKSLLFILQFVLLFYSHPSSSPSSFPSISFIFLLLSFTFSFLHFLVLLFSHFLSFLLLSLSFRLLFFSSRSHPFSFFFFLLLSSHFYFSLSFHPSPLLTLSRPFSNFALLIFLLCDYYQYRPSSDDKFSDVASNLDLHNLPRCSLVGRCCSCNPIFVTMFPEWLSGSALRNHGRAHPVPCVRPRCVVVFLRARVPFCRFDKADTTADVQ